jgi:hypothetical protein
MIIEYFFNKKAPEHCGIGGFYPPRRIAFGLSQRQ